MYQTLELLYLAARICTAISSLLALRSGAVLAMADYRTHKAREEGREPHSFDTMMKSFDSQHSIIMLSGFVSFMFFSLPGVTFWYYVGGAAAALYVQYVVITKYSIPLWPWYVDNQEANNTPVPPNALNPLETVARFNAELEGPKVLTDKLAIEYSNFIMTAKKPFYERAVPEQHARSVNHLTKLIPGRGILGDGETTIHSLIYPFLKDATFDDTAHSNVVQAMMLEDFRELFYGIKVGYTLPQNLRTQHHQIIANSGHGKTQCIQSMVLDDWQTDASVVVIDSQGDLINTLLAHAPLDRVVLIDPKTCPPSLNIFATKAKGEIELATAIELFEYIFSALDAKLTGKQSLVYRYLSRLLMEIPGATIETMRDLLAIGGTEPYQELIDKLGGNAKAFFDEFQRERNNQYNETRQEVLRRLLMVLESETLSKMLGSPTMAFDFSSLLDSGKTVLISTSRDFLKSGYKLFGRIFIAMVMQAVMSRKGDRKRTYLYIDEFRDYAEDSEVLFSLFEQARKYELGLIICHQYLGQLPEQLRKSISANTAIKFAGGVSAEDARALAGQMQTSSDAIDAVPSLTFQAWFKGIGSLPWKVEPGRLEKTPKHTDDELDEFRSKMRSEYGVSMDLPGFCGERLAHFPCLSFESDGALEAER